MTSHPSSTPVSTGSHLRAVAFPEVTVLVDLKEGTLHAVTGAGRRAWADRAAVGRSAQACWGTGEVPARLALTASPPGWRLRALGSLALTLLAREAGPRRRRFARMATLAGAATVRRRPADAVQAEASLRAVRRVAGVVPARVACLEESVAALVALALAGFGAQWRHGVATDPVRLHAWIEVDGNPVDEPASTRSYTPVLRFPEELNPHGEGSPKGSYVCGVLRRKLSNTAQAHSLWARERRPRPDRRWAPWHASMRISTIAWRWTRWRSTPRR